jgi:Nuclease-related domain
VVAAARLGWRLRYRPSADTRAWRRGARGERRTARLLASLERRGWAVLHDLAIPGSPANLDHLVIGPGGVIVIDSKQYRGRLHLDPYGMVWHGRHLLVSALRRVLWHADQADEVLGIADIQVAAIVAVHGASVPWGLLQADGVTIVPARRCPTCCRHCRLCLGPSGWPGWPTGPGCGSAPPPDSVHGSALQARLLLARHHMEGCCCP